MYLFKDTFPVLPTDGHLAIAFLCILDRNRLDTVEEVTEPMSSYHESLPLDKFSGQPSSDFMNHESLPPDAGQSGKNSMTMSVTSREEVFSVSEVEVVATTWPPSASQPAEEPQKASSSSASVMTTIELSKSKLMNDVYCLSFVQICKIDFSSI